MAREIKNNGHYSEQPGHSARGEASRIQRSVERRNPEAVYVPPLDVTLGQLNRRKMRRISRDGRI